MSTDVNLDTSNNRLSTEFISSGLWIVCLLLRTHLSGTTLDTLWIVFKKHMKAAMCLVSAINRPYQVKHVEANTMLTKKWLPMTTRSETWTIVFLAMPNQLWLF